MKVKKRDKTIEEFQLEKIRTSVGKAFETCSLDFDEDVIDCVTECLNDYDDDAVIDIDIIHEAIQDCLCSYAPKVAVAYVENRYKTKVIREVQDKLTKEITKKLMAQNVENQNANVDEYSFGGRQGEAMRVVTKDYALKYCVSKKTRNNHNNNEIYLHDLDSYAVGQHNCLSIPFDDLLANGFSTRQTDIRPAKSINTAMQLVAVIFQLQSLQQFGGVSATHLDWTMVPYVRMSFFKHYQEGLKYMKIAIDGEVLTPNLSVDDELYKKHEQVYQYAIDTTEKELRQSVEGLYHNLNTLQSRSGNQLKIKRLAA